mgnify:CR=1 FL=1
MYKVLIVEEDEIYSARLKDSIERNGYDVVSIKNPVEAVANFVGGHYDLVVSEQIMEGMNGIQMISILRGIHPTLKSIILTSNPDDETNTLSDLKNRIISTRSTSFDSSESIIPLRPKIELPFENVS